MYFIPLPFLQGAHQVIVLNSSDVNLLVTLQLDIYFSVLAKWKV